MKIAIPTENGLICPHFGHCESFTIFTVEGGQIVKEETVEPPVHEHGSHPAFVHELGCTVVIAGGMGTKSQELTRANGIQVITGAPLLSPRELADTFLAGKLESRESTCHHA